MPTIHFLSCSILFLLLAACGSDGIAIPEGAAAPDACASCNADSGGTATPDAAEPRPDAPVATPSDAAAERRELAACSAILCVDGMLRGVDCPSVLSSCDGNCQAYLNCNEACIADSGVDYDSGPCMESCSHSGFDGSPGGPVGNSKGSQYLACACCGTVKPNAPEASTGSGGSLSDACAACADARTEANPGTGGNAQTGGSTGSGGSTGTGGPTGSGGIVDAGSGGSADTGGTTSTGGAPGTGGATMPPPEFPGPDGGGTWLDWPFCIDTVNEPDTSCCRNTPQLSLQSVKVEGLQDGLVDWALGIPEDAARQKVCGDGGSHRISRSAR
jgi:hypothetical protein